MNEKLGFTKRHEGVKWSTTHKLERFTVEQWNILEAELNRAPTGDELAARFTPEVVVDETSNLLTTAGATRLAALLTGTGQALDATHTLLGVGDTATAANVADTSLGAAAGSTHQYWMTPDATYPSAAAGVVTVKATWASGDGNFAWNEWGLQITTSAASSGAAAGAGVLLNHKIASLGTKTSAGVWSLTVTITIA